MTRSWDEVADDAIEANLCAAKAAERRADICDELTARGADSEQASWVDGNVGHFWESVGRYAALHRAHVRLGRLADIDAPQQPAASSTSSSASLP